MIKELLLLLYSFTIQDFIFLITSTIDIFAATIIAVSIFQTIIPMVKVVKLTIISTLDVRNRLPSSSSSAQEKLVQHDSRDTKQKGYWIKKNFVRGLLHALELESANAILKMGLFTSIMIEMQQPSLQLTIVQNINNFIFFVAILSIRVAINQTLRKYSISR
jgi:hypothetical protein